MLIKFVDFHKNPGKTRIKERLYVVAAKLITAASEGRLMASRQPTRQAANHHSARAIGARKGAI